MIPKECKRLAEVDFPIAVVSKHAAREKSIRHGHPSTLHLWWARRPLAACRAMLMGLLLPDPCDKGCPSEFKEKARELLPRVQGSVGPKDEDLSQAILKFIGDFASWELSSERTYLEVGRGLVKAAHDEEMPLVVDPFAGGGSIPLEALRLGCEAFASDLNPVACLILKTMLEDIPRHGPALAEELRRVGAEIKAAAEKELTAFYPPDPNGARPIAYLWARTVQCESPNCGAEIPLMRSFWLCKKANSKWALRYKVVRSRDKPPQVEFEVFEPKTDLEVPTGTVTRAKATCLCCNIILSPDRVRRQLSDQHGGADVIFDGQGHRVGGARLLAAVILNPGEQGRQYRLPRERDYEAVHNAMKALDKIAATKLPNDLTPIPDEPLPPIGTLGFRVQRYGMLQWGDLFTARQKLALVTLVRLVRETNSHESETHDERLEKALQIVLSLGVSKLADLANALCSWEPSMSRSVDLFARQAISMIWDFSETGFLSEAAGDYGVAIGNMARILERGTGAYGNGYIELASAMAHPLPHESAQCFFTDPPYYDAVPYADLSDFFFVWLKRTLVNYPLLRDTFDPQNQLTPKTHEAIQDETKQVNGRPKDRAFFEETMAKAFAEGRRILKEDGIGCVVFAHKTTEGWEALLAGMIRGGWVITGSWPISTEWGTRLRARESAALATSIHLICRPRTEDKTGDWGEVLRELPKRVSDWMERLQGEGVRGADLVFACIGPALEIFSRYSKVETAEGREVSLPEFLEKVWEVVGRTALEKILGAAEARTRDGATGAMEEDARLTALFLWTLQSTNSEAVNGGEDEADDEVSEEGDEEDEVPRGKPKGFSLIFDVVRRFAQPLGIHLPDWENRIIETKKGVVRLLPVAERARQLFGEDGAEAVADRLERSVGGAAQLALFAESIAGSASVSPGRGRRTKESTDVAEAAFTTRREATTLDRVHAAMLLQAGGRANALRALLKAEQERSPDFLRLANALSALYPKGSEEKRLLDAMLLAVPR